jgi:hypothetical protein
VESARKCTYTGQCTKNWEPFEAFIDMQGNWYAESVRLTFFVPANWTQRPIFSEIVGIPPAEQITRPPLGLHQEAGSALGAYLTVGQQPGRIDIVLSDTPNTSGTAVGQQPPKSFVWAGPLTECIEAFDQTIDVAVKLVDGMAIRVAYAITSLKQVETVQGAMKILKEALPNIDFNPERDVDLIFQINRPREGRLKQKINRLVRWEVLQSNLIRVEMAAAIPMLAGTTFAARVYADMSTDEKRTIPFNQVDLLDIVKDVRSEALEVLGKGTAK